MNKKSEKPEPQGYDIKRLCDSYHEGLICNRPAGHKGGHSSVTLAGRVLGVWNR